MCFDSTCAPPAQTVARNSTLLTAALTCMLTELAFSLAEERQVEARLLLTFSAE